LGYIANVFGFDDANGESPQLGDIFGSVTHMYAAAVFVIVPIDNVMAAVFDAPVATVCCPLTATYYVVKYHAKKLLTCRNTRLVKKYNWREK